MKPRKQSAPFRISPDGGRAPERGAALFDSFFGVRSGCRPNTRLVSVESAAFGGCSTCASFGFASGAVGGFQTGKRNSRVNAPFRFQMFRPRHQRHQRAQRRILHAHARRHARAQPRQRRLAHACKPARRLRAHPADAARAPEPLPAGAAFALPGPRQLLRHPRARHPPAAQQRLLRIARFAVVAHAQRRAQHAHRKDRALVRVHAAGRLAHARLRQQPRRAQRIEARRLVPAPPRQPLAHARPEVGAQRARAVDEREQIHVPVRARIQPVHQTRLGRERRLRQQRALGVLRHAPGKFILKVRADELLRPGEELLRAVRPAARAGRRRLPADQAAARRQTDVPARDLLPLPEEHVDVQQPPHRAAVLQRAQPPLDLPRVFLDRIDRLRPGRLVNLREEQALLRRKHRLNARLPPGKGALDLRVRLDRPGDVHRQADQRRPRIPHKQRPLHLRARLPRRHHVRHRHPHRLRPLSIASSIVSESPAGHKPRFPYATDKHIRMGAARSFML